MARRIPSDDCQITTPDGTFWPHRGEEVIVREPITVANHVAFARLAVRDTALAVARGDADESEQVARAESDYWPARAALIVQRLESWTWTGIDGARLPLTVEAVLALDPAEIDWLAGAVLGVTPESEHRRLEGLADHLLGFSNPAIPGRVFHGPQPVEALIAAICSRFPALTPATALEQPWPLTLHVVQALDAQEAIGVMNGAHGDRGKAFAAAPHLAALLRAMRLAQTGDDVPLSRLIEERDDQEAVA